MGAGPFLVVGESLVDVVPGPAGVERLPGGSPLNVAVGLARLGVPTLLVTELGDDDDGRLVVANLAGSGVRLSPGSVHPGRRTSTATARLDAEGVADYDFALTWDPTVPALAELAGTAGDGTPAGGPTPGLRGLHVGSLGTVLKPGREAVLRLLAEATEPVVSYDPNVRAGFLPSWEEVRSVAEHADLVKVSEDDLLALRPDADPVRLARTLLETERTELVVVTRGAQGTVGLSGGETVAVAAPRVEVVDTVGAGDSFMAALLAILDEWRLLAAGPGALAALDADRLRLLVSGAAIAAAVTVGRRGANPPTRAELPPTWPAG